MTSQALPFPDGFSPTIAVVGGAGHVGLPLSLVFADRGRHVLIYDINPKTLETIASGVLPFMEEGAEALLQRVLASGRLGLTTSPEALAGVETLIITIGTPIDEFLSPTLKLIKECIDDLLPYINDRQHIVLRSTVYPGVTEWLNAYMRSHGKAPRVSFCPERIVQGHAVEELQTLPQIVSGTTPEAEAAAAALFDEIAPETVMLTATEAELAKLFSNAYRYIQFAAANQFYMMAAAAGVDYYRVIRGLKANYPRARDIPGAGLAAGPCLFKDTMQLSAFYRNQFSLGHAAMLANEGMPAFIVEGLRQRHRLDKATVGLLGMAFKAESDDPRSSLSYKLKKMMMFHAAAVLTTDPYVKHDGDILPLDEVLRRSDIIVLCVPHNAYRQIVFDSSKEVVDIWGVVNRDAAAV